MIRKVAASRQQRFQTGPFFITLKSSDFGVRDESLLINLNNVRGYCMGIIGGLIMLVAVIGCFVFGIQLLILAFRKSVLWGLGSLFVPFVSLVFVIMNWEDCKRPFLGSLAASVLCGVGGGIMAMGAH